MDAIQDAMELLEQKANRIDAEEQLFKRIGYAKRTLIFARGKGAPKETADATFWASLVLRMGVVADWNVPTAYTDGTRIGFNPDFVKTMPDEQLVGVLAHEVAHCALNYFGRIGFRDPQLANIAHDLVINPILEDAGFILPPCRLMPGVGQFKDIPKGLSFEETYALLPRNGGSQEGDDGGGLGSGNGNGKGMQDPGGTGVVVKAGDGSEAAQSEAKATWDVAVSQAAQVAKMRGTLSEGLERLINEVLQPIVDWREVLRQFVSSKAKVDYRWTPPNRRFVAQGIYLPARTGEQLGEIVIAVDESGSMSDDDLAQIAGELNGILAAYESAKLTILHHDTKVSDVERWTSEDGPLVLTRRRCGGTCHKCVFEWIGQQEDPPTCLIALTDLDSTFPSSAPDYPVLWCTTQKGQTGPFGQTVEVVL